MVYEITKADMEHLLEERPEIAEELAQVVSQRRLRGETALRNLPTEQQAVEVRHFASQLMDKMRGFFNVFRRSAVDMPQDDIEKTESSIPDVSRDG